MGSHLVQVHAGVNTIIKHQTEPQSDPLTQSPCQRHTLCHPPTESHPNYPLNHPTTHIT